MTFRLCESAVDRRPHVEIAFDLPAVREDRNRGRGGIPQGSLGSRNTKPLPLLSVGREFPVNGL